MILAGLTGNLVWEGSCWKKCLLGLFLHCTVDVPEQHWQCLRDKVCPRERVLGLEEFRSLSLCPGLDPGLCVC